MPVLETFHTLAEIHTGDAPFGLAFDQKAARLYAVNVRDGTISVIDIKELKQQKTIDIGEWPYCAVLSPSGELLLATNEDDNTVSVVDTKSLAISSLSRVR